MLVVAEKVFDNVVSGAGTNWYSPAQLNEKLGAAEKFFVQASVSGLTGTSPTLTVALEVSGDNQIWVAFSTLINGVSITNDTTYGGKKGYGITPNFVRVRISLGGTSPQCRLKVYIAGQDLGHRSTGSAPGMSAGPGVAGPVSAL